MTKEMPAEKGRNSGIDLFRVIGIVAIIISHVIQTLGTNGNACISYNDYYVDCLTPSHDYIRFVLSILLYGGVFGNTVFFICSAWFLFDKERTNKRKIFELLSDNWLISISILIIFLFLSGGGISNGSLVIKSLFPTLFENNWYLNCYILFYALFPILNRIIKIISQKIMLRITVLMTILYFGIVFLLGLPRYYFGASTFYASALIYWITIYFVMAYLRMYLPEYVESRKVNIFLALIGGVGVLCLHFFSWELGMRIGFLKELHTIWRTGNNPFNLMLVLGLFNLIRHLRFKSAIIRRISALSLYIYLIHENLLVRTYTRPAIWQYIYTRFGYNHLMIWLILFVVAVVVLSILTSIVYQQSIHKIMIKACKMIYKQSLKVYIKWEEK